MTTSFSAGANYTGLDWTSLGSSALGMIGAGISGAMSSRATKRLINAQKEMMREQMAFQERMSSTAHQREVADLREAGLNPVLSANNGASSPQGAMANITSDPAQAGLESAMAFKTMLAQNKLADSQAVASLASASNAKSDTRIKDYTVENLLPAEKANAEANNARILADIRNANKTTDAIVRNYDSATRRNNAESSSIMSSLPGIVSNSYEASKRADYIRRHPTQYGFSQGSGMILPGVTSIVGSGFGLGAIGKGAYNIVQDYNRSKRHVGF